jgi:hypothetical protein
VTLRKLLFKWKRNWSGFWLKRTPPKPPHWVKDIIDIFDWINLLPTFCLMAFAPRHFFRRAQIMRRCESKTYKTPIKFLISAIPFIIGLKWLPIGFLYRGGVYLVLKGILEANFWVSDHDWSSISVFIGVNQVVEQAEKLLAFKDVHLVSVILLGTPLWIPLVSCFVAFVLLLPRLLGYMKTRQILPLLVSADPKTYLRIRVPDYLWNMLYFAVYFLLTFPVCLLLLFAVMKEFLSPSTMIFKFVPLRLWFLGTYAAMAMSLITAPYNELLQASVVIPTPLMQYLRLSKLLELAEKIKTAIVLAENGDSKSIEEIINSLASECRSLERGNDRFLKSAEHSGAKWVKRFDREMHSAFLRLNISDLIKAQQLALPPVLAQTLKDVNESLVEHGADTVPPVVPPKVSFKRRLVKGAVIILVGVVLVLLLTFVLVYIIDSYR